MGAKKRAKLEAKAEKRVQREAELKSREEQKKRDGEDLGPIQINIHFNDFPFQPWQKKSERNWKTGKHLRRRNAKKRNVSYSHIKMDLWKRLRVRLK